MVLFSEGIVDGYHPRKTYYLGCKQRLNIYYI